MVQLYACDFQTHLSTAHPPSHTQVHLAIRTKYYRQLISPPSQMCTSTLKQLSELTAKREFFYNIFQQSQ